MYKVVIIIFFFLANSLHAQEYTHYSVKNGLPSNHVYRITQDNLGFIWFITDKGMIKYNGSNFKLFTTKDGLPSNDIWDIRIGSDNKVWFFTKAATLGYIQNDTVYAFESEKKGETLQPASISQYKNEVFFTTSKVVYTLQDSIWKKNALKEYILAPIKYKNLLFYTKRYNTNDLFIKDTISNQEKVISIPRLYKNSIYRGQLNDSLYCWINTKNTHILKLADLSIKTIPLPQGNKFTRYSVLNNNIQFSGENFVAKLSKNYTLQELITIPKKYNAIYSFLDKNDNLWIATMNNGAYFVPKAKRTTKYTLNNKKVGRLKSIKGELFTTVYNEGFYKYDSKIKQFEKYINNKGYNFNIHYFPQINTSYFVGNKIIFKEKNGKINQFNNQEIARDLVYYKHKLYGYNSAGITVINPTNYTKTKTINHTAVRTLINYKNKLFIGTANGLKELDDNTIKRVNFKNTIFDKPIISLDSVDAKHIIIGTNGFGAYITDFNTIKLLKNSDYLTIQDSFVQDKILWIASNQGVLNYKKIGENYIFKRKHTTNDGLTINPTNSVFVQNDTLYASSNYGVSILPLKEQRTNTTLAIYINDIQYNGKTIKNESKYTSNATLSINTNTIDYASDVENVYFYKLEPLQTNWIQSNSKTVVFNDLQPNEYIFHLKKGSLTQTQKISIKPLWYQLFWVKTLTISAFLLAIITMLLFFRKKELQKQKQKLEAAKRLADFELHALRSQMNPHFVFNSLNAIQYYITKNEIDLSEKYLVKFARLIRMFFDFSREETISLAAEIKLLKGYLEIEKMRFGENFDYTFNIAKELQLSKQKIPSMLLQPIVENAVNHGIFHLKGKGLISISFLYVNDKKYQIIIADNGVGRAASKVIQNKSLKYKTNQKIHSTTILKERISLLKLSNEWNITYKIEDEIQGTTVILTFENYA